MLTTILDRNTLKNAHLLTLPLCRVTCPECGHPKETLCGWERETPLRWVCSECYGEMKSQSKGEKP